MGKTYPGNQVALWFFNIRSFQIETLGENKILKYSVIFCNFFLCGHQLTIPFKVYVLMFNIRLMSRG